MSGARYPAIVVLSGFVYLILDSCQLVTNYIHRGLMFFSNPIHKIYTISDFKKTKANKEFRNYLI